MAVGQKTPELTNVVIDFLKNPNSVIRGSAASALGRMQAKESVPELVKLLKDHDGLARGSAALALGRMQAKEHIPELVELLNDTESTVRWHVVDALALMRTKDQIPQILRYLKDPEGDVVAAVAEALAAMQAKEHAFELARVVLRNESTKTALTAMGPFDKNIIIPLSNAFYFNHGNQAEIRFLAYYLTGGDTAAQLLLHQIMLQPGQEPVKISSIEDARQTLRAFYELMSENDLRTDVAFGDDADKQILRIATQWRGRWSQEDLELLNSVTHKMGNAGAAALRLIIKIPWWQSAVGHLWKIVGIQIVLWALLLYFYPDSPSVQAFFFWNRWVRKFLGLGYVDFLLTWVPFLRNRLLSPFREGLVMDAQPDHNRRLEYFDDVDVREIESNTETSLSRAIPHVFGQIILEGGSGLGKSMFLRALVGKTQAPIAYLPASRCDKGVVAAIQDKVEGYVKDEAFLKTVIYSGGIQVVIDGLNEVSVETREKIRNFLDAFPKAHVLLATQPMNWKRPPRARLLRLLELSDDRILRFLLSRYASFDPRPSMSEEVYEATCKAYLGEIFSDRQTLADRSAARRVLSNPMDLTTAAQILATGAKPTLTNLQDQQFEEVRRAYENAYPGREFPLKQFCESVYERRLCDELALDSGQFREAINAMAEIKMVFHENDKDDSNKEIRRWLFRHDKIRDYFLMKAVLNQSDERIWRHIDDLRFRGVYLMLAYELPVHRAVELQDILMDRAAETKDHTLLELFVQILKPRKPPSPTMARPS
jgi:hypothetical protein